MAAPLPVTVGATGNATVLPPLILILPELIESVCCGTSRLKLLVPNVVDVIPPEVTIEAGAEAGSSTEFPPVMLKLPDAIESVGCGTVTV
jgi:hypothetical protein